MENQSLHLTCTALAGVSTTGHLEQDGAGYYKVLLAALNIFNVSNVYYSYERSKHIFLKSSEFMNRIQNGKIFGERDHPPYLPGMTDAQFIERNEFLDIANEAFTIREVWTVVTDEICNGNNVVEVWGWIKPSGEHGHLLKELLDDPHRNVCFSLRALSYDGYVGGVLTRRLDKLITIDWVYDDGLKICNKYSALKRGSKVAQESTRTYVDRVIKLDSLRDIVNSNGVNCGVSTESSRDNVVSLAKEYLQRSGDTRPIINKSGISAKVW